MKDMGYGRILRKTMENISEDIWCLGQDTKQAPPKYQSEVLPLLPVSSVYL
jgi:hypothetical protein